MTELRDDADDLIRTAIHELVASAPEPAPLPELSAPPSRRWLAVAASVVAIAVVGGAIAVLNRGSTDGSIASPTVTLDEPGVTSAVPSTVTTPAPTTTPSPTTMASPVVEVAGWTAASLPGEVVEPWISTGELDQIVELGGRRLTWAREPSGAAFMFLSAWLDEGAGWEWFDLAGRLGVGDDEQPVFGDWPVAAASDGSTVVAVGADAFIGGDAEAFDVVTEPRAWVTTDLLEWELVELPGRGRLTGVTTAPGGWIAVGEIDGQDVVFGSIDGRTWTPSLASESDPASPDDPSVVRAGDEVIVTFGDGRRVIGTTEGWSDRSVAFESVLYQGAHGVVFELDRDARRLSRSFDGTGWEILDVPMDWLADDVILERLRFASLVPATLDDAILVSDGTRLWTLRPGQPAQEYDLTEQLPATEWGPSYVTGIDVLADGTIVVLGAIPHQPGNKPASELVVLTSGGDPVARARDRLVGALVTAGYVDIGGDHDVPGSATFGVEAPDGSVVTGSLVAGLVEPIGDLADTERFISCEGFGITIRAETATGAIDAVSTLGDLSC